MCPSWSEKVYNSFFFYSTEVKGVHETLEFWRDFRYFRGAFNFKGDLSVLRRLNALKTETFKSWNVF